MKIDALLVHTYWYDLENHGQIDICNHLQLFAVGKLWEDYEIRNVVIVGGHLYGGKPPIAAEIKKYLKSAFPNLPEKSVHVWPSEKTTFGEVKRFKKIVEKYKWQTLAALGLELHLPRIKRAFRRVFKGREIVFFVADKVLADDESGIVNKYHVSPEFRLLKTNETIVGYVEKVPIIGNLLLEFIGKIMIHKGYLQPNILSLFSKSH